MPLRCNLLRLFCFPSQKRRDALLRYSKTAPERSKPDNYYWNLSMRPHVGGERFFHPLDIGRAASTRGQTLTGGITFGPEANFQPLRANYRQNISEIMLRS